jgi:hypothetical protein
MLAEKGHATGGAPPRQSRRISDQWRHLPQAGSAEMLAAESLRPRRLEGQWNHIQVDAEQPLGRELPIVAGIEAPTAPLLLPVPKPFD